MSEGVSSSGTLSMDTTLGEFYDLSREEIGNKRRNLVQENINNYWKHNNMIIIQFTVNLFWYLSKKQNYDKGSEDREVIEQLEKIVDDWDGRETAISNTYHDYLGTRNLSDNDDRLNIIGGYENKCKKNRKNPEGSSLADAFDFLEERIRRNHTVTSDECEKFLREFKECVNQIIGNQGTSKGGEMEDQKEVTTVEGIEDYIKKLITNGERQIIFTGAPGTGKTRAAKKIAEEMIHERNAGEFKIIQFHPSYDYTDFVEGIKPIDSGNGEVVFRKIDGEFKKFCRNCFKDRDEKTEREEKEGLFFFIIDEINRADLSKVFGEIMYCLDKDKRGENGKLDTQYQFLPTYDAEGKKLEDDVYKDGFYIPRNVVILGTMNDIDRSVESMDFALRRRFSFVEFEVTKEMIEAGLKGIFKEEGKTDIDEIAKDIAERLDAVNEVIYGNGESLGANLGLNKQYYLSHGILANLGKEWDELKDDNENFKRILKDIFERRIKLTLKEYVRGEDEKEVNDFIKKCEDTFYEMKPGASDASAADHSTDGQDENGEQN